MRIPARFTAVAVGLSLALMPALPALNPTALSAVGLAPARAEVQKPVLRIGAIPDQNPEKLNRLYGLVANELSQQLGVTVKYVPLALSLSLVLEVPHLRGVSPLIAESLAQSLATVVFNVIVVDLLIQGLFARPLVRRMALMGAQNP